MRFHVSAGLVGIDHGAHERHILLRPGNVIAEELLIALAGAQRIPDLPEYAQHQRVVLGHARRLEKFVLVVLSH